MSDYIDTDDFLTNVDDAATDGTKRDNGANTEPDPLLAFRDFNTLSTTFKRLNEIEQAVHKLHTEIKRVIRLWGIDTEGE